MTSIDYHEVNWEDAPSQNTPLSAENLNNMDVGLASLYRDVAALETAVENINRSDGSELTVTFGEPGEEGVDDAPLQPSGSTLEDIVTGIHSRIRAIQAALGAIQAKLEPTDVSNDVTLIPGQNCSATLINAVLYGNILWLNFTVSPTATFASGGNLDVDFTGFTPVVAHDFKVGGGVKSTRMYECWLWNGALRCRKMYDNEWPANDSVTVTVCIPVEDSEE